MGTVPGSNALVNGGRTSTPPVGRPRPRPPLSIATAGWLKDLGFRRLLGLRRASRVSARTPER